MPLFEFQLVLADVSSMTEEIADAVFEAGHQDATPFSSQGIAGFGFSREADNLEHAIRPAILDIERAGFTVKRVQLLSQGNDDESTCISSSG